MSAIGVLGGTFDPIHLGHYYLGKAAIDEVSLDKLIVMPANIQPFKQNIKVSKDVHRLAMARLAFASCPKAVISEYEIMKGDVSYSFDTMSMMKMLYPGDELFFVMGTDSFIHVDKWYKGGDLLHNFSFIVSSRPGYPEKELDAKIRFYYKDYGTKIIKLKSKMPDISSTDIRETAVSGKSIKHLVPEAVEKYIIENGLYED